MRRGNLAVVLTILAAACVLVPPPQRPADSTPIASLDEVDEFTRLVNEHRRKIGCRPLVWVNSVAIVAQQHSENMYRYNFFDHIDHDGKDPFERLAAARIRYRTAAENIAAGQWTAESVLEAWLSSPGHRRNIENCTLLEHGLGLSNNRWTHLLVRLR